MDFVEKYDPGVVVTWSEVGEILLSEKDKKNPTLAESKMVFDL